MATTGLIGGGRSGGRAYLQGEICTSAFTHPLCLAFGFAGDDRRAYRVVSPALRLAT